MTQGCVHNVKEVDMTQRRRRRREPTTSIQSNVRGRDVTWQRRKWRDVDDEVDMVWRKIEIRLFMANPAKIFITIWFESYVVVSQAFQTLDKNLDLNSMFLKVEK